jgi:hypothetical protein
VEVMTTVREAKLKPECADRYPTLPARMWTAATSMAALVASFQRERSENSEEERTLSETDFEFRGGSPAGRAVARAQAGLSPSFSS